MVGESGDKYDIDTEESGPSEQNQPSRSKEALPDKKPTNATRMRRRREQRPDSAEAFQTKDASRPSNDFGDTFSVDVAEKARGNFLITIGYPGSGKSTFHSHLYRMCEEIHHVDPLHASGQSPNSVDPVMESRVNAWRRKYHMREQVDATEMGEANIYEVAFRVTPRTRRSFPLDLRVIEVSGEDLRKLDNSTTGESTAEMPQAIGTLLSDKMLNERNIIVAFMVDPDPDADPIEFLVDGLLSYMKVHGPKRLRKTKFCIIIPKPLQILEALTEYKEQYPDIWARYSKKPTLEAYKVAKDVNGNLASFYLSVFKKNLVQRLKTVAPKGGIMRSQLYLGEIEQQFEEDEGQERPVDVLTTVSYRDAAEIFSFLYEGFTSKKLKPGALDKLRGR